MSDLELLLFLFGIGSVDPNDKVGPAGAGPEGYVGTDEPVTYTVFFENLPDATAPAKIVTLVDRLDPTKFDLASLSLGPISFGSLTVTPPAGSNWLVQDVDLSPAQNLIVRIAGGLNATTGELSWRLTAIDPVTGGLPANPLIGFLPPNAVPPEGEGSALFTVRPVSGLTTGSPITNSAEIVFDFNDPITTPVWGNTIDADLPVSSINPLDPSVCCPFVEVAWSGTDVGSGIEEVTLYVSTDGGPLVPWINTPAASEVFAGEPGRTYGFASRATDHAGNREALPVSPQTVTTITGVQPGETVRLGSPPNPNAYLPGITGGPVVGATWDPVIDHSTFAPTAVMDLMLVTGGPANAPALAGTLGTILCDIARPDVFVFVNQTPGSPFQIPLPSNCNLIGAQFCTQGGSLLPNNTIPLANALDIVVGTL